MGSRLGWLSVLHDKEAIGRNDDILEVMLDINDLSDFLGGAGALVKVGVGSAEIRALLLGSLPCCSTSEGHSNETFNDVTRNDLTESSISVMNLQI
jgi:hypothetical protein